MSSRTPIRAILVVQDPGDAERCLTELTQAGYDVSADVAASSDQFEKLLQGPAPEVILADCRLPGGKGQEPLTLLRNHGLGTPVILLGEAIEPDEAVEYLKQGAADYVRWSALGRLPFSVQRALEKDRGERDRVRLERKRRKTERKLRARAQLFHQLAETVNEVCFVVDAEYKKMFYISPAYERVWGKSCASLYQEPFSFAASVVPEDQPKLLDYIARIRAGENVRALEMRIRRPDGTIRCLLANTVAIRDSQGRVARLSGIVLDITERKAAEEALRVSEARLRTLFETVNLIVLALDSAGRVEYVNPYFLKLSGYRNEEIVGRDWFEMVIPPNERPTMNQVLRELLEDDSHTHHQNAIMTKAGERRTITWHNTVVRGPDGQAAGTLSVGEDVTEHQRLEEQFRQAQKMEAIGRLAGGIAHDFNNLLTVIMSYAATLRDELLARDPRHEHVAPILKAAEAAAGLTRQLLTFSRQEMVRPRVVTLEDIVVDSEKLLKRVIGEDVALRTRLHREASWVRIDPDQLEQIIMNLAVNARDAMPHGGELSIETERISFDEDFARKHGPVTPGEFAMLAISDTGTGMDESTKARIFEPFFTTKERGKGTGLGLATVYGIVKQNGGFIWVYSEIGHGTTFKIYLPLVDPSGERAREAQRRKLQEGSEVVLLAEDAAALRRVARLTLERCGYSVLEAADGPAALELAAGHSGPIHLLLSDVVMPEMSGGQLAERFQAVRPDSRVLFMSGYTDDTVVRNGVVEEGMGFLQKPFTPEMLASRVREALDAPMHS